MVKIRVLVFLLLPFLLKAETSYPYLSGYTWLHYCDWRMLGDDYGSGPEDIDPEKMELGDTLFLDFARAEEFSKEILPKLKTKIILISANYGYSADDSMPGEYGYLVEDERILAWFVQNIDRAPSEKLIPIPIGIASKHWKHGNTALLDRLIPFALPRKNRSNLCYLNFSVTPERQSCADYFHQWGIQLAEWKSFGGYLSDLSNAVFVVSPPGNGIDCHRTWEALLMGCYPIVKSSTLNPLYEDLPVIRVDEWTEITPEFLREKQKEFEGKAFSREKLYADYWFQKVRGIIPSK